MGHSFTPAYSPSPKPPEDRLDSWKEIAAYFNRDVTTVQRWEKREGMPVHRHVHDKIGSIYASRAELDAWARSRKLEASRPPEVGGAGTPSAQGERASVVRWKPLVVALGFLAVVALRRACGWNVTEYFWRSPIADAKFQTITDFEGVGAGSCGTRHGQLVVAFSRIATGRQTSGSRRQAPDNSIT